MPPSWSDWVALGVAALTVLVGVINFLTTRVQRETVKDLSAPTKQALDTINSSTVAVTQSLKTTTGAISKRLDSILLTTTRIESSMSELLSREN